MSRTPHNTDPTRKDKAAVSIFWRLFRMFAGKYWFRLTLGITAGFIMGGASAFNLRFMDSGLNVFGANAAPQTNTAAITPDAAPAPATTAAVTSAAPAAPDNAAPATPALSDKEAKSQQKILRIVDTINRKLSELFGWDLGLDTQKAMSLQTLILLIGGVFLLFMVKALGEFTARYCLSWVGARIVTDIRIALFDRLQHQSVAFYDQHDVGQLIARCTNDTASVEKSVSSSVAELLTAPLLIIVSFQFIITKALGLNLFTQSLWLLLAIPGCIVPVYLLSRYLRKYQKRVLAGIAVLVARMQENFSGIRIVKAFNTEAFESRKFTEASNRYFRSVQKALLAATCMQPIMQIVVLAVGAVFLVVCYKYGITLATLAVLGYAAQEAYRPIKELAKVNNDLQKSAAACERILEILDCNTGLPVLEPVAKPDTFSHDIVFDHVSFRYNQLQDNVIKDFSLTIHKGQLIAIVGQTGSGKSTIANLLSRLYDPTAGDILIDGINLKNIDNTALRNLVGIVSQDTFLFNDTIAANISYGSENATPEQIAQAARQANAEDFILAADKQYEHNVGERGNLLSGGQKQRLSIARALLRNPPILILDEATSALDTKTERLVQDAFDKLMKDRTVVAIAHRLSTIINASLILVCDHGTIIEQGTHEELYNLNGTYRKLYDLQFNSKA